MSKIVKLTFGYKLTEEYRATLAEAVSELEDIEQKLNYLVVNLALSGKWKEWSDSQPVGTKFYFTEEMVTDTGDSNVNTLIALCEKVTDVKNGLK